MKERLTAGQARAMATNWQDDACAEYIDNALDIIRIRAQQGFFTANIQNPSPNHVDRDECIRAMKELGFSIDHVWSDYIRWKW